MIPGVSRPYRGKGIVAYPVHTAATIEPVGVSCGPESSNTEVPEPSSKSAPHDVKVALLAILALPKAFLNFMKGCLDKMAVDAANTVDTEVMTIS